MNNMAEALIPPELTKKSMHKPSRKLNSKKRPLSLFNG
jgi:hypothetical protein